MAYDRASVVAPAPSLLSAPLLHDFGGNKSDDSDGRAAVSASGGVATSWQTLVNIVVCTLGTGALSLPYAFRVSGWLAGSLAITLAASTIYYCMLLLVQCRRKLEESDHDGDGAVPHQTYGDIGAAVFGVPGRYLTELLVFISYTSGAVSYLVFIGQNLSSVFHPVSVSTSIYVLLLPLEMALSFMSSLSVLAPFSAFANACNILALSIVLAEDVQRFGSITGRRSAFSGFYNLPFAIGVGVFCFDGAGMTLALESSMAERRRFPWVLFQAFFGLVLLYGCFGVCGYMAFGDETRDIVTLNLSGSWLTSLVKIGLCVAISFSFPMTMHPVYEIMEAKLSSYKLFQKLCCSIPHGNWLGLQVVRMLIIAILSFIATSVPGFAMLVSLIGSTVSSLLAFILPATFHLNLMARSSLSLCQRMLDYTIICVGLVFACYNTYATLAGSV